MKRIITYTVFALAALTAYGADFATNSFTTTAYKLDMSRLFPGFGPDALPVFNGMQPKGEAPGEQFADLGVDISCISAACFASNQHYYQAAHGNDFPGDPGPEAVFVQVTTLPPNGSPGGQMKIRFDSPVRLDYLYLMDANRTVNPRVVAITFDSIGNVLEIRTLAKDALNIHFTRPGVRYVLLIDAASPGSGGDGFILAGMTWLKTTVTLNK